MLVPPFFHYQFGWYTMKQDIILIYGQGIVHTPIFYPYRERGLIRGGESVGLTECIC